MLLIDLKFKNTAKPLLCYTVLKQKKNPEEKIDEIMNFILLPQL